MESDYKWLQALSEMRESNSLVFLCAVNLSEMSESNFLVCPCGVKMVYELFGLCTSPGFLLGLCKPFRNFYHYCL